LDNDGLKEGSSLKIGMICILDGWALGDGAAPSGAIGLNVGKEVGLLVIFFSVGLNDG